SVLAHILSPEDFGLMGMVLVVIGIGQAFADFGLSQSIIWKQEANREQLSSLYCLNVLAGIGVFAVAIAISPLVSTFFRQPQLVGLMFWAAFIFPITAAGSQFQTLLQKNLAFRKLAIVEIASASSGALVSILTALMGQGVMALVWGQLAIASSATLSLCVIGFRKWRPRLVFKVKDLEGFISFGLYQMGQRAINALAVNVDYIMVGRFLGPDSLGAYMLAWQVMVAPVAKLNPVLTRVAFPVFARRQDYDDSLQRNYVELSKMVALLTLPIAVMAAASAPVFVPLVFGPQWTVAIPIIQIFLLLSLFRSLSNPVWSMLFAKGKANVGFSLTASVAVTSSIAFWFAAQRGIYAMAWTEVAVEGIFFSVVLIVLRKIIGLSYLHYFKDVGKPTTLAFAAGAVTYGFYLLTKGLISSDLWLLVIILSAGLLSYAILVAVFERQYFVDYLLLLLGRKNNPIQEHQES
ncbi:MAG: MOP flippase family protein, partial [Deltaproteobacteria bacterium]|nr:MOP flippase family protein [Deltaproteobacteria bacterium]